MHRAERLLAHLPTASPAASADERIVVVSALRTPLCRSRKGALRDAFAVDLLAAALRGVLEESGVRAADVGDVVIGNVLLPGGGSLTARQAALMAGLPADVPVATVNRQCSSGLQAVANVAAAIRAGEYEIGIAGGFESMTKNSMMDSVAEMAPSIYESDAASSCLVPMGITSENVAEKYGIARERQDAFAERSHRLASAARERGDFAREIVPVHVLPEGADAPVTVTADDGIRSGTTVEKLATLAPAFMPGGSTTAGNASQTTDGAAAVLLMRESTAKRLGLAPKLVFESFDVVGCDPQIMGIGPALAIPRAVAKANISLDKVDVFEINEAFASQAVHCCDVLGLDMAKVNPNGGAIALGHPLGCTGARMVATLANEMDRKKAKYGVVSMCIGGGMGAAAVFSRP